MKISIAFVASLLIASIFVMSSNSSVGNDLYAADDITSSSAGGLTIASEP